MLNYRDSKIWGLSAISLSVKRKAVEVRIARPISDEINGEIQEIKRGM